MNTETTLGPQGSLFNGIGGYTRQFTLGDAIDQGTIEAALKDGVLTLTLPKAERLKRRKVEIAA